MKIERLSLKENCQPLCYRMKNTDNISIGNTVAMGLPLKEATSVLIMVHGRGGSASDILTLGTYLHVDDFTMLGIQGPRNSWYPYSFMAPVASNEPWLSASLKLLGGVTDEVIRAGFSSEQVFFLGFSQGACLMLEFLARNATRYGGAVAFTGGLIGETLSRPVYRGDFRRMPVFIGTSDPDMHVPVERVYETADIVQQMHAGVTVKVYQDMGHTIIPEELALANQLVFGIPPLK